MLRGWESTKFKLIGILTSQTDVIEDPGIFEILKTLRSSDWSALRVEVVKCTGSKTVPSISNDCTHHTDSYSMKFRYKV